MVMKLTIEEFLEKCAEIKDQNIQTNEVKNYQLKTDKCKLYLTVFNGRFYHISCYCGILCSSMWGYKPEIEIEPNNIRIFLTGGLGNADIQAIQLYLNWEKI